MNIYFTDEKAILIRKHKCGMFLISRGYILKKFIGDPVEIITSIDFIDKTGKDPWLVDFVPVCSKLLKENIHGYSKGIDLKRESLK